MSRIRVLEVLEATAGGTRKHLVSLLRGLDRDAFDVEVAAPLVRDGHDLDTLFAAEVKALGVPFHAVALRRRVSPIADLKGVVKLTGLMRRGRYDVVHLHSSKAGFLGRIAGKLNGIKTVYTPNGFYFLNASSRFERRLYLLAEQVAGWMTDRLVAVSESERETTVAHRAVAASKVVVIPNAIEEQDLHVDPDARARVRRELQIPSDAPVIGTVARFLAQKDPLTLIEAARLVVDQVRGARLLWCGEGGDLVDDTVRRARELGVYDSCSFLGFRRDVPAIMNACDVFVLSSIFEGLPYSLLEAMALGLPVVATDVVGNRDVVVDGRTGVLVPPQRPAELAAGVVGLLRDPARRRELARAGSELVRARYGLARMVSDIEALYRSLVNGK